MKEKLSKVLGSTNDPTAKVAEKLSHLQQQYKSEKGRGKLTFSEEFTQPEVIPTGIPELDNNILSIGGLAKGRVIELAGDTNAGKSTLAWNIAREAVNAGCSVVIAENEGTFTEDYAEKIGLLPKTYHLLKGKHLSGPEFLEEVMRLCELGVDLIIVDSLFGIEGDAAAEARLVDMKMNTKQSGAQLIATFAKLWKNGWKPFTSENRGRKVVKGIDSGTTLILINHLKTQVGGFGKETPGSVDVQFLYSQRVWLERLGMSVDDLDENKNPIYTRVKVTCRKSKLSPGGRSTTLYVDNRNGRFETDSKVVMDIAIRKKVVMKAGAWFKVSPELDTENPAFSCLKPDMKWQGAAPFIQFCTENKQLFEYLLRFNTSVRNND